MDKFKALGIKVEYTYNGINKLMTNDTNNQWSKNVGEIAEIKKIQKPDNHDWYFMVLQRIDLGHIIRIFCPNAGRNDYICASIFVPWGIVISGKELSEIVDVTKIELLDWNKDTSKAKLENLFSKTYEFIDTQQNQMETSSDKIAYRFYGEYYQLYELLDNLDQPYYSSYNLIFFIDKNSNIQCNTGDDLTNINLIKSVTVNPPKNCNGFAPYIEDALFSKPIKRYIDSTLCISWKREGYKTIEKTTKISSSDVVLDSPNQNDYKILVPYSSIVVRDKNGSRIDNYRLRINNKNIAPNDYAEIHEDSINRVHVIVTADGYEQYDDEKKNFKSKGVEIVLDKKTNKYTFILPRNADGVSTNEIIIKTKRNLVRCPIEGYVTENGKIYTDHDNKLVYKPFTKKHLVLCLIIVALSLCVGICAGWFVKGFLTKSEIRKLETEISLLKKEKPTQKNDNKSITKKESSEEDGKVKAPAKKISAIEYLDNNEIWNRAEMEKFEDLKGLWDAMNERKFDDILKYRETLSSSKEFNNLIKCVENNKDKKGLGLYNTKTNDHDITIKRYINNLNNAKPDQNKGKSKDKENNVSENKNSQGNW